MSIIEIQQWCLIYCNDSESSQHRKISCFVFPCTNVYMYSGKKFIEIECLLIVKTWSSCFRFFTYEIIKQVIYLNFVSCHSRRFGIFLTDTELIIPVRTGTVREEKKVDCCLTRYSLNWKLQCRTRGWKGKAPLTKTSAFV